MRPTAVMPVTLALSLALCLAAVPVQADGTDDVVARGSIAIGVFGASIVSYGMIGQSVPPASDGVYGFTAPLSGLDGAALVTEVVDHGGAGHFVKLAFLDHDGAGLDAECTYGADDHAILEPPFGTAELSEDCLVPPGAATIEVTAHLGVLLDVTVRLA